MNAINRLALLASLDGELCQLNHGKLPPAPAVDYIVQPMGYSTGIDEVAVDHLVVMLCQECIDALASGEWFLAICLNCSESQWFIKALMRKPRSGNLKWVQCCPKCGG